MSDIDKNKADEIILEVERVVNLVIPCKENAKKILNDLKNYVENVLFWGETHNVISRNYSDADVWENVYDSICSATKLSFDFSKFILDAGTGGGVPGIPLAILFSDRNFILVDSSRKKCSFLRLVRAKLSLKNITVENRDLRTFTNIGFIVTKAAFSPGNLYLLADALEKNGRIAMWATPKTNLEYENAFKKIGVILETRHDYFLPRGKERCLLLFRKL